MTSIMLKLGKEFALGQLHQRKRTSSTLPKTEPTSGYYYHYCKSCGALSDVQSDYSLHLHLHELCQLCQEMEELGWLPDTSDNY